MIVIQKELFLLAENGDLLIQNDLFVGILSEKFNYEGKHNISHTRGGNKSLEHCYSEDEPEWLMNVLSEIQI